MVRIAARVITGPMLEEQLEGSGSVQIERGAVLTPSAFDYLNAHEVSVVRDGDAPAAADGENRNSVAAEKRFRGIFVPNIVIFDDGGNINFGEMERYIAWLIDAGIHGLYPNGSTGEFVRLSAQGAAGGGAHHRQCKPGAGSHSGRRAAKRMCATL